MFPTPCSTSNVVPKREPRVGVRIEAENGLVDWGLENRCDATAATDQKVCELS